MPNPFRVGGELEYAIPRVLAALEPWAEISERLRRKFANAIRERLKHNFKTTAARFDCCQPEQTDKLPVLNWPGFLSE